MTSLKVRKMTYAAMLLALAVLMPRVAGLIPDIGKTLNLMHIPVLLCGFMCGWQWGLGGRLHCTAAQFCGQRYAGDISGRCGDGF